MPDQETEKRIRLEAGKLNTSDDLIIWAYGAEAQSELSDFSRGMAGSVSSGISSDAETLLLEVIQEIDKAERRSSSLLAVFSGEEEKRDQYRRLLKYMNHVTVQLQMDQAGLIKDLTIMQQMEKRIRKYSEVLEAYIDIGHERLDGIRNQAISDRLPDDDSSDQEAWCERFGRRLQSLETSKVVALQNIAQVKLLIASDRQLIDQLGDCITIAIPLWRNQIAIQMGISDIRPTTHTGEKFSRALNNSVKAFNKAGRRRIDSESVSAENEKLKTSIQSVIRAIEDYSAQVKAEDRLLTDMQVNGINQHE